MFILFGPDKRLYYVFKKFFTTGFYNYIIGNFNGVEVPIFIDFFVLSCYALLVYALQFTIILLHIVNVNGILLSCCRKAMCIASISYAITVIDCAAMMMTCPYIIISFSPPPHTRVMSGLWAELRMGQAGPAFRPEKKVGRAKLGRPAWPRLTNFEMATLNVTVF